MTTLEDLVDRYCEAWSTPDAQQRERLLRATLAPHAIYCDPRSGPLQIDALLAYIAQVHARRPGSRVTRTSDVDVHHRVGRFHWQMLLPDGEAGAESLDVIELSAELDAIERVTGFFGPLRAQKVNEAPR